MNLNEIAEYADAENKAEWFAARAFTRLEHLKASGRGKKAALRHLRDQIAVTAEVSGNYQVWLRVFAQDKPMLKRLIVLAHPLEALGAQAK